MAEQTLRTSIQRDYFCFGCKPGSTRYLSALPHLDIQAGKASETDRCACCNGNEVFVSVCPLERRFIHKIPSMAADKLIFHLTPQSMLTWLVQSFGAGIYRMRAWYNIPVFNTPHTAVH